MRILNEKEKEELTLCGRLGFNCKEVSVNFDLPYSEVSGQFSNEDGEIFVLWKKGRMQAETEIRQSVLNSAINGSTPSLLRMIEIYKKTDDQHRDLS